MQQSDTGIILAYVRSIQGGGEPTRIEVAAWHELIGDLDYDLARQAIAEHFRSTSGRVWPADIRKLARPKPTATSPYNRDGQLVIPRGMRVVWNEETGKFSHFEPRIELK